MSNDNITDLFGRGREEPSGPTEHVYKIYMKGKADPIIAQGFMSLTGSFVAIAQGAGEMPVVQFVAPTENYDYVEIVPTPRTGVVN